MARKGLWLVAALVLPVLPAQSAPLAFSVQLSEAVVVDTGGGVPRIALDAGGVTRQADYTGGSGTDTLSFSYAIQAGDFDANGIAALSPIDLSGATITDAAGNAADLGFVPPDMSGVRIQTYTVAWASDPITTANAANAGFTIAKAPVGASFDYTITASGWGGRVTGSGTIAGAAHAVTGVDLSSLPGGTLTLSVTVTTAAGGTGASRTAEVAKTPWTPADLGASLALWLDADDASTITLNGVDVSQWNDRSGNGRHVAQATAALQPVYVAAGLNGKPGLTFDQDELRATFSAIAQPRTVFVVNRIISYPGINLTIFDGSFMNQGRLFYNSYFGYRINAGVTLTSPTGNVGGTAGNNVIVSATYSGASSTIRTNGTQVAAGDAGGTPLWGFSAGGPTDGQRGHFIAAEFIMLTGAGALSLQNQQIVEGYLAHKWGLAANLPADHPYKAVAP